MHGRLQHYTSVEYPGCIVGKSLPCTGQVAAVPGSAHVVSVQGWVWVVFRFLVVPGFPGGYPWRLSPLAHSAWLLSDG